MLRVPIEIPQKKSEAIATLERPENPAGCAVADGCVLALKLIVEATQRLRDRRLVAIHQITGSVMMLRCSLQDVS
jgi:hypothetical protein